MDQARQDAAEERLRLLAEEVRQCHRCQLRRSAQHVVFGEGNPRAALVFVGEGPGAEEDRLGRPFVGAAGQLLDKMLAAMGMTRFEHAYILNIVKCRPPGNRIPTEAERLACRPHLDAQMTLIDPIIVVLLGSTALQTLIDPAARISRWRGRWIVRDNRWFMPTYHPAALLRNPEWKRPVWADLKQVLDKYRALVDPNHESPYYPLPPRDIRS
ncbi:Uracil-DNA glycosylase [Sulfobacillus acidophilus TPY]|uniref:Type-4 uracil-DNA glycosylase n=1 Tax=Sulfobacillus acidophilus (strain ATCC 700253 / DSM 10332 / NAL) TaxID=679936 RepID=G8U068_SULAD|nr:Uracil-DNA glycosylase [Sulfobacillus acidophilus TPY]AEW05317.1 phage SPO1 DNA polymerase-related protein [Sulfobacillus acidophilus DSM 10332]